MSLINDPAVVIAMVIGILSGVAMLFCFIAYLARKIFPRKCQTHGTRMKDVLVGQSAQFHDIIWLCHKCESDKTALSS